jgi:hypothetical protein
MNPSFNISALNAPLATHLFVFTAKTGIAFAALHEPSNKFVGIRIWHFPNHFSIAKALSGIQVIINAEKKLAKTDIIWCNDESIIIPEPFFNKDTCNDMLKLVYGDAGEESISSELVKTQNAYNVYKLPAGLAKSLNTKFPLATQSHQASLLINLEVAMSELVYCNFYYDSITVLLRKNNQLQIVKSFDFNTPEDAVYHLLNVCRQFTINPAETFITANGMIDRTSNLYKEIYKYFLGIHFYELPDRFTYIDEIKKYPSHYFSHLFALASCVL